MSKRCKALHNVPVMTYQETEYFPGEVYTMDTTGEQINTELQRLRDRVAELEALAGRQPETGVEAEGKTIYRLLADNITDVMVTLGMNLKYNYASPSIERMLGYSAGELISTSLHTTMTPSSRKRTNKVLKEELALDKEPEADPLRCRIIELEFIHKNRSTVRGEIKLSFLRDADGNATGLLGILRDITHRKLSEAKLLRSNRRLLDIIDFLPDATFVVDSDGRVIAWNRAIEEMTGVPQKEIIGKGNHAYGIPFYGYPRPGLVEFIGKDESQINYKYDFIQRKGSTLYGELFNTMVYGGNGAYLWIKASPLYDAEGNLTGAIESIRDITQYKKMENELRKHRDHLEELVRERTGEIARTLSRLEAEIAERKLMEKELARLDRLNLVGKMAAAMGHEIRNPMTSVRGFLQMLRGKEGCEQYGEFFDLMIGELDRANDVISEFLYTAKDKYVEMKLQNLNEIIRHISPLIITNARSKRCTVAFQLNNIPDVLLSEKEIRQLILNLVRNSLDAMPGGGEMTIKTYGEDGCVILSVQDQGEGIDPSILDRIGTPFLSTKESGTGLGLAICYGISQRHNASIEVSTGREGTTFSVRFAMPAPDDRPS